MTKTRLWVDTRPVGKEVYQEDANNADIYANNDFKFDDFSRGARAGRIACR